VVPLVLARPLESRHDSMLRPISAQRGEPCSCSLSLDRASVKVAGACALAVLIPGRKSTPNGGKRCGRGQAGHGGRRAPDTDANRPGRLELPMPGRSNDRGPPRRPPHQRHQPGLRRASSKRSTTTNVPIRASVILRTAFSSMQVYAGKKRRLVGSPNSRELKSAPDLDRGDCGSRPVVPVQAQPKQREEGYLR